MRDRGNASKRASSTDSPRTGSCERVRASAVIAINAHETKIDNRKIDILRSKTLVKGTRADRSMFDLNPEMFSQLRGEFDCLARVRCADFAKHAA